jgi:hypothetical protein
MSKRIIMSIVSAAAMSIGGWFVSCGSDSSHEAHTVMVQLPDGCSLVSPRSPLGALDSLGTIANVKTGENRFVIDNAGQEYTVVKSVADGDQVVKISAEELH